MQHAGNLGVCYFPLVCCVFKMLLTFHHKYLGTFRGMSRGTSLLNGLSVTTTTRIAHLPVTWALRRIDQVAVSRSLPSFFSYSSFVSMLWPHKRHFQTILFVLHK